LVEINVVTGEKKTLLEVEHDNYLMEKKGDILYLDDQEDLIAFDTTTEEEVWRADTDSALSFYAFEEHFNRSMGYIDKST